MISTCLLNIINGNKKMINQNNDEYDFVYDDHYRALPIRYYELKEYKNNKNRTFSIQVIQCAFEKHECVMKLSEIKRDDIIFNIELSIYNKCCSESNESDDVFYIKYDFIKTSIVFDLLTNDTNSYQNELIVNICDGKINPKDIAYLSPIDRMPSLSKHHTDRLEILNKVKIKKKYCVTRVCRKCGSRNIWFNIYQGKKLDEGNSHHYHCDGDDDFVCNNSWFE